MRIRVLIGFIISVIVVGAAGLTQAEVISNFVDKINPFEKLELAGYLKNETAFGFADEHDELQKFKNAIDLKGNYKLNDSVEFYTNINFWYDAVYDIEGRFNDLTDKVKKSQLTMPEDKHIIRELYMDVYTDAVDLRLGKQFVVWGTTDGVRILDLVNPLDYREWTLKEFSDLRIPLWMLKAEGGITKNSGLQLLLIPDYEPNYYPPADAPFALRATVIGAQATPGVTVKTIENKPERTVENTKVGLRWRDVIEEGMFSGLEYTLNYLHTYDSAASYYVAVAAPPPVITLSRNAEQIEVFGGSFSKTITKGLVGDFGKGWTLRGEFAYISNGAMNYGKDKYNDGTEDIEGTVDVDQINYAFGFDKTFLTNWQFSTQFIQLISKPKEEFDQSKYTLLFGPTRGPLDKFENLITLKVSTDFIHERLKPEVLVIYGDDNDWRISPKVSFEVNDNLILAGGIHIFEGRPQHLHGQLDDLDQIFIETKYSW
ncbi:MAG: hypothetical protein FJZ10_02200 [Candidatus Omnitrophica bacterium]|nr:hypothetical protein [Candidatus Omnitrophota bacterium]